jgi:hypothetical protein
MVVMPGGDCRYRSTALDPHPTCSFILTLMNTAARTAIINCNRSEVNSGGMIRLLQPATVPIFTLRRCLNC